MSFKLTPEQQAVYDAAADWPGPPKTGSAKWEIQFNDGKHSTMLSEYCHTKQEALLACVERFGAKVKDVL